MPLKRFCDLGVADCYDSDFALFKDAGVKTVAFNKMFADGKSNINKNKMKRDIMDIIPAPEVKAGIDNDIEIKHRITIEFSDSSIAHKLNKSENLRKYDIIAVIPTTLAAFQYACNTMDIDLISFHYDKGYTFKINRKLYQVAVDRGIFFEIMYGPALKDITYCKNIIKTAHLYHALGKSRNILLTSWAETSLQLRGPNDLINLGLILGLDKKQCNTVVMNNPRFLLIKADGRRKGKAPISMPNIASVHLLSTDEEPLIKKNRYSFSCK